MVTTHERRIVVGLDPSNLPPHFTRRIAVTPKKKETPKMIVGVDYAKGKDETVYSLVLPYPPTVNRYLGVNRNGIRFKMKEGADYCKAVRLICNRSGIRPFLGPVIVTMHLFRPRKSGDLLNRDKVLLDSLEGYAYSNDKNIVEFHAFLHDDKENPRVHVLIKEKESH
jgi:Holliday junction resolvase RusA-like endonuclease